MLLRCFQQSYGIVLIPNINLNFISLRLSTTTLFRGKHVGSKLKVRFLLTLYRPLQSFDSAEKC